MSNYQLLIHRLDAFIRKYYLNQLLRGSLIFLSSILAYYLVASVLEYNLYFSTSVRKIILLAFIGLSFLLFIKLIVIPLSNYLKLGQVISHENAAKIIGNHFENIKDKLLNILQLHQQNQNVQNKELIEASINQKIENIKLVPFTSAINLSENKKYLPYLLPILLLILGIILLAPQVIKESNERLITPNTVYAPKAPFDFILENKNLKTMQFGDIEIKLKTKGEKLPNEVYLISGKQKIKLEKLSKNEFSHRLTNLQSDTKFYFSANEFNSNEYNIQVFKKPIITNHSVKIIYPSYTGKKSEILKDVSDILIPIGTKVTWTILADNTDNIQIFSENSVTNAQNASKHIFSFSKQILQDTKFKLLPSNSTIKNPDTLFYSITTIPDNPPIIQCQQIIDSTQRDFILMSGSISDDYALSKFEFVYRIFDENDLLIIGKRRNLSISQPSISTFDYPFNIKEIELKPGQRLEYFMEVWDNDAIHGAKSSKSQTFQYKKMSVAELENQENKNNEAINDGLSNLQDKTNKLSKQIEAFKQKILSKNSLSWEDKKAAEQLRNEQQQLLKEVQQMDKKYEDNLNNQKEFKKENEEILQKQEKIQEMLKDLMKDELKDLMQQIEDLMSKMQQKNAFENLDKMQMSNQNLKKELEKMQELFKQLQLEQKAQETIDKLNKLAEEQKQLSEKQNESNSSLKAKQDELNKNFENIKENIKQLEQLNKDLDDKMKLDQPEKDAQQIEQNMDESSKQLQENQKQNANQKQKKAAEQMKNLAQKMQNSLDQMQMDQNAEDIQLIRKLLDNLLKFSFEQEKTMQDLKKTDPQSPKYVQIMQKQANLKEDADMIADSLQSLGKRQFQLQNFISDEIYKLNRELKKALDNLQERYIASASSAQQFVMTAANNLALMLSESLDNLQMQQKQKMSGDGNCKKPGKEGQKPSMNQMQKELGEQLKNMQQQIQQGKEGQKMSKELAEAAEKQAMIREMLRKMKEQMSQEEKDKVGVDDLLNKMDDIEKDIVTKNISNKTINRQKEIETRLLEYDKAKREQGEEEKRQSKSAPDIQKQLPPALQEYLQKKKSATEMYQSIPPNLQPFYKNLVDKYFQLLQ